MKPWLGRLGGAHTRYERFALRNIVPSTEFEPQIVRPVGDILYSLHNPSPIIDTVSIFYHNLIMSTSISYEITTARDNPQLDSTQPFTMLNSTIFSSVVSVMKHTNRWRHNHQYHCHFTQIIISNSRISGLRESSRIPHRNWFCLWTLVNRRAGKRSNLHHWTAH
jgi:hypothetical protein